MGLDINGTRFLLYAMKAGVDYSQTAMIGRQGLHLKPVQLQKNFAEFGFACDSNLLDSIFNAKDGGVEQLFRHLGADKVESFDNSSYEGATHLHDMNLEISDTFKERYSVVLDGGSLEHIFNFPVAIKNCMEMTKIGGYYLGISPMNNLVGHGFYQLSPELYFSVFTKTNGFEIVDLIAHEPHNKKWYSVISPLAVGRRVTLVNNSPVYLLVIARRTEKKTIFESPPQQSDYITAWKQKDSAPAGRDRSGTASMNTIKHTLSRNISRLIKNIKRPILKITGKNYYSGFNPDFFTAFNPATPARVDNQKVR